VALYVSLGSSFAERNTYIRLRIIFYKKSLQPTLPGCGSVLIADAPGLTVYDQIISMHRGIPRMTTRDQRDEQRSESYDVANGRWGARIRLSARLAPRNSDFALR
jgi:hypothetical protein